MKTLLILSLSIFLVACHSTPEWSKWRGPNASGTTTSQNEWSTQLDSSQIIWNKNIGKGHSAITVYNGKCYVNGWTEQINGTDTTEQSTLYCLDAETGDEIWSYTYPSAKRDYPGPRATPVIDNETLYFVSWEGVLFSLDALTGTENWKRDFYSDSLAIRDRWGFCSSPVIYNNLLLLNLNKHGIAFDKSNGQLIWSSKKGGGAFSSTTLFDYKGQPAGTFMSDSTLYIVNVTNGSLLNQYVSDKNFRKENDVILTDYKNELFVSTAMLRLQDSIYTSVWRNDTISPIFRTGIFLNGYIYQFNNFRNKMFLHCIDPVSGKVEWKYKHDIWGAVSGVDDKLIVLTGFGKVVIAEANPASYTELSQLQVFPPVKKSTHWCWTAPSFAEGKIFVRNSNGDIACLQVGS